METRRVELHDYVKVLRKQWRLIVLVVLLVVGATVALTAAATPQYQTTTKFFVSVPSNDTSAAVTGNLFTQQRVKSYVDVMIGPLTAKALASDLDGVEASDIEGHITGSVLPDTSILTATVSDASPERALAVAKALTERFPQIVADLERRPDGGVSSISARVTEQPELPTSPFSPRPVRNLGLALALGLLLGVGLAVLRETLDNSVKTPEDVRDATGAATLAAIGFDPGADKKPLIVQDRPQAPRAEAFRQLRTNLQFVQVDNSLRSFVITSSVPKEGKSTTACNLAITLAQSGISVALIEGDLRRPRIADYLGIEGSVGLTTVLIGKADLEDALQPWGDGPLQVLASGPLPPNPSELLSSSGMQDLLRELEDRFEVVIIDAPPLLPVTDAAILGAMTNGAVLSVHCGATTKDQLHRATEALTAVDAPILGVVLNLVPRRGRQGGYGYGYGYGSYGAYDSDTARPRLSAADADQVIRRSPTPRPHRRVDTAPVVPGNVDERPVVPTSAGDAPHVRTNVL